MFQSLAERANGAGRQEPDLEPWHALQRWLERAGPRQVTVPFSHQLAEKANPRAVRLRRDFGAVLSLIQVHAILHEGKQPRLAVRELMARALKAEHLTTPKSS